MRCRMGYNEYVFDKGKFIGKFEEMYQKSEEVPWHQDVYHSEIFGDIGIDILKRFTGDSFCDIACDLGYYTARIQKEIFNKENQKVYGLDLSSTAIEQAKQLQSDANIQFYPLDLLKIEDCLRFKKEVLNNEMLDVIMIKEVLWYVVDHLNVFIDNINLFLKPNGFLYVHQSFPEVKEYYGQKIFPNANALRDFFTQTYQFKYQCIERDARFGERELIHLVLSKE